MILYYGKVSIHISDQRALESTPKEILGWENRTKGKFFLGDLNQKK